ncbi:hypothetical protein Dimus_026950 [Dionaea muscipula]
MALPGLKRIRAGRRRGGAQEKIRQQLIQEPIAVELKVPSNFLCPISLDLMKDPVVLSSGVTFDRSTIERWLESGNRTCPVTKQLLIPQKQNTPYNYPIPNHSLRKMIQDWCVENRSFGMERIPTPKTPLPPNQALDLLKHGDDNAKQTAVVQLKRHLSLPNLEDDDGQQQTLLDRIRSHEREEFWIPLLDLIRPRTAPPPAVVVNSCLYVIFRLILVVPHDGEKKLQMVMELVRMGLVGVLLQILVDYAKERSICERALGIFDVICECEEGREEAYRSALTVPVLVKRILRVSDAATEYSVSALWKLLVFFCRKHETSKENIHEAAAVEAVEMGAFQKLLLLLQIGCTDATKEKATEILKLLNACRDGVECIDSADFKNLKRPF